MVVSTHKMKTITIYGFYVDWFHLIRQSYVKRHSVECFAWQLPYRHFGLSHSDSKCACWHIFSLISRQSGAHQTCTKQLFCGIGVSCFETILWSCYFVLFRCKQCVALCQKCNMPEQQSCNTGGHGWRWKSVICTYHTLEWFIEEDEHASHTPLYLMFTFCVEVLSFC